MKSFNDYLSEASKTVAEDAKSQQLSDMFDTSDFNRIVSAVKRFAGANVRYFTSENESGYPEMVIITSGANKCLDASKLANLGRTIASSCEYNKEVDDESEVSVSVLPTTGTSETNRNHYGTVYIHKQLTNTTEQKDLDLFVYTVDVATIPYMGSKEKGTLVYRITCDRRGAAA